MNPMQKAIIKVQKTFVLFNARAIRNMITSTITDSKNVITIVKIVSYVNILFNFCFARERSDLIVPSGVESKRAISL